MKIDILTLFPEMFDPMLSTSIIGRAVKNGVLNASVYNIRDFAKNKHKQVDDYPYGGGHGMIMAPQPLFDAIGHVLSNSDLRCFKGNASQSAGTEIIQQLFCASL
jgi:tRNA (guanine37-N1)-methyltransferase